MSDSDKKIVYINNGGRESDIPVIPEQLSNDNSTERNADEVITNPEEVMDSDAEEADAEEADAEEADIEEADIEESSIEENTQKLEKYPEEAFQEHFEGGAKVSSASVYDPSEQKELGETKPNGSYASSVTSDESMNTAELLSVDPLYFRLNLFLKSDEGENVANLLKKVCNQLETLNNNFDKLMKTSSEK